VQLAPCSRLDVQFAGEVGMSKYGPLSAHLSGAAGDEWRTTFSELEAVLGFPLPKAARAGRAWWANDPEKSHSRAWAAQGWEVGDVDHAAERVVFRRGAASGAALVAAAGLQPLAAPAVARNAAEPPLGRFGTKTALAAGLAVVAGIGALLARSVMRRR
jgi:hypothetical protein